MCVGVLASNSGLPSAGPISATELHLYLIWHTFAPEPAFLSILFLIRGYLFFHFISSKFWNFLLFYPYNLLYKLFSMKYLIIFLFCPFPLKHKQAFITLDTGGLFVSTLSFNLTIYHCQSPLKRHAPSHVPNLYYLLMVWHSISQYALCNTLVLWETNRC